jgi:D-alanyl-D-alanine endopeptidase (penicillin-binding protein 7)
VRARAAIVADLDRMEVLWSRAPDLPRPVASLTKMVSALTLARQSEDLDRRLSAQVCITPEQWPPLPGAPSRFETGTCHEGWELLGAALVASDNRGAMGLAAVAGLPVDTFVQEMDATVAELGMKDARFADPSGVEDANVASARDVLKAVVAVAAHPVLAPVASAREWRIDRERGANLLGTTNRLIDRFETLAAKTGYTDPAGYCLASVVRTRAGRTLAAVVLGAPTNQSRFHDTEALLRWAEAQ